MTREALLVASYPQGRRPEIPFPYFAEGWTGEEYQFAAAPGVRGHDHGGPGRGGKRAPAPRRRAPQPLERAGVRPPLRTRHVRVGGVDCLERVSLLRRGTQADAHASRRCAELPLFLVGPGRVGEILTLPAAANGPGGGGGRFNVLGSLVLRGNGNRGAEESDGAALVRKALGATWREEGKLRVVAFEREVRILPGQPLTVSFRS